MIGFELGLLAIPAVILVSFFVILPIGLIVAKIADYNLNSYFSRNRELFIGLIVLIVASIPVFIMFIISFVRMTFN